MNNDDSLPRTHAAFERLTEQATGLDTAAARRAIEHRGRRRRQGFGALAIASTAVVAIVAIVILRSDEADQDVATPVSSTTSVPSTPVSAEALEETTWTLVSGTGPTGEIPMVDGWPITLTFDGTGLGGTAACNSYAATYRLVGSTLTIEGSGSEEAACSPAALMESQNAFLTALDLVDAVALDDDRLVLSGPSTELVFAAEVPVPTDELVGPRWLLDPLTTDGYEPTPVGDPVTLFLDPDGTFEASTACRYLQGEYVVSGAQVQLPTFEASGQCPPELTDKDDLVVSVLGDGFTVEIDGARLTITSPGNGSLSYRVDDGDPPVSAGPGSISGFPEFLEQQSVGDDPAEVSGYLVNRGGPWVLCESARGYRSVGHLCDPPWLVVTNYDRVIDPGTDPPTPPYEAALDLADTDPDFDVFDGTVWTPAPITLTLIAVEGDPLGRTRAAVSGWPTDAELTADNRDLVAAFDAIDGSDPIDIGPLRLAESGAQLGLSSDLIATRTPDELTDPAAWALERDMFRASGGSFSALELLAGPRETIALAGSHGHCANPPMPVHPDLQGLRQISIQPVGIDSCLQWFTVDLFLDDAGDVSGITLDLYEP